MQVTWIWTLTPGRTACLPMCLEWMPTISGAAALEAASPSISACLHAFFRLCFERLQHTQTCSAMPALDDYTILLSLAVPLPCMFSYAEALQ